MQSVQLGKRSHRTDCFCILIAYSPSMTGVFPRHRPRRHAARLFLCVIKAPPRHRLVLGVGLLNCAWEKLLDILPPRLRPETDRAGRQTGQQVRLRLGQAPRVECREGVQLLTGQVEPSDLAFVINAASRYSPWASEGASSGYVTAPGGHRVGICGVVTEQNGRMTGIRSPTSVCIRIARDFPGIAQGLDKLDGGILLIGKPGSGKTTLLRDLVRRREGVAVVDERGELFPVGQEGFSFSPGAGVDVLTGCQKGAGILNVLRTMSPRFIAVDEITHPEDAQALVQAAWCGVSLLATAHAGSLGELERRGCYRPLLEQNVFEHTVIMQENQSWRLERKWVYR